LNALSLFLCLLAIALPIGMFMALAPTAERRTGEIRLLFGALALGAVSFAPAAMVERVVWRFAGFDEHTATASDLASIVYAFLVVAPLEQGLKVAAFAPIVRTRYLHRPFDGVVVASAVALGFVSAHNAVFLWARPGVSIDLARALLAVPAHMFCAGTWGYALARDPRRRLGGRLFKFTWLLAMLFNGIYDHIVFVRGPAALLATAPILLCMGLIAYAGWRDLLRRSAPKSSRRIPLSFLGTISPPSIRVMREALRRTERPVLLSWILFGALVTTGVLTAGLSGAVVLGHRIGIDFAAVERGESSRASIAPLILLGAAALTAFPVAGFLVARASSARSVLEPAVSAALAIFGSLVLLGLAAPVAVVFALALAPIALALACAGAWMGMAR
jgi:hypothetical protein